MSPKNHPASVSHFLAEAFHQADMPFMSSIIRQYFEKAV
ncbi:hypothetical protein AC77_1171 [Escherichia coli 5-366-08_S4_C1]|uniref:Uncharacterized protein n=1 Tax=Escherichia coli TaxID=562 RepID=A0A9P1K253_ECOLX|nr:hypothetical protein FORC43_p092 [Escherichia coli]KDX03929.1 hypothetical protein AD27_5136 [Escherichia coli 2-177-06_S4_C3]KEL86929.1 hypothetical protein AB94_5019 [Escherichia coli 5-366-08_S3_C1]KEO26811.1 hypothetical protein AC77_1171 [Escherichia coli 5-366-08_S4_C1]AXV27964.1 hypothetical protein FORC69_p115 [Escherichia coli]